MGQCDLIISLIKNNEKNIDYFGIEIDNNVDFQDKEMELKIMNTSFMNFFFEDNEIDYSNYSKVKILNLAENLLAKTYKIVISEDDKDMDFFI